MVGKLTIHEPNREPYTLSLTEGKVLAVGRGQAADVIILDKLASRIHCEIWHTGKECVVSDLESLNGTFVNGKPVKRDVLQPGDLVAIGSTEMEFSMEVEAETAMAESVAGILRCARCEIVLRESGRYLMNAIEMGSDTYCAECASHAQLQREQLGQATLSSTERPEGSTLIPLDGGTSALHSRPVPRPTAPTKSLTGVLHPDHTVDRFLRKNLHESANIVVTRFQKVWYFLIAIALIVGLCFDYLHMLHLTHLFCSFYLLVILFKLACVGLSVIKRMDIQIADEELAALKDEDLPVYTILVPLYKEREVADKIVKNMRAMDYPQEKLDVKLLLEEDDEETQTACREADLPDNFHTIVVADSLPKTKPKACNHGLEHARGEYLVIYDAEDRPEPDQLKKAIYAFRNRVGPKTICIQGKLNYFNPRQNFLTKWFTIEYTTWFDLYLPGLHALGAPIPLGGTSNHFKTEVLQEIGGWDPFNVTEDCDLGIRLYRMGYKTEILDSTTWEEANSELFWNWIRQRSRWVKGYLQTHLVHMRQPFRTLLELGPWKFFSFLVSVGGLAITLILNPIFWFVLLFYGCLWITDTVSPGREMLGYEIKPWRMTYPMNSDDFDHFWSLVSHVFFWLTATLFLGNFFFMFTHVFACFRRKLGDLIGYALLMPLYWFFISWGAWKGFLQLFFNPFYWEKTQHGLDTQPALEEDPAPETAT